MNQPSADIRTEATKYLLEIVDSVITQWKIFDFSNALDAEGLKQIFRNMDRARRQFNSKLFFVVVFGPLKAGKSTLTNVLAGECVSPAGFGKETTRRPTLVIPDEESGIEQYFSNDSEMSGLLCQRNKKQDATGSSSVVETDKVREAFDLVADYLRGIRGIDEVQEKIHIKSLPLNGPNLEQTLTQDLPAEPIFTVIRCKGGHFLSPGVAIVDMPGLDGNRSNWRDAPIHKWVIDRAEFFLFVQSSIAAWNRETMDFVREIIAQSTKPPIWLIQNIFDSQHWQPEEKRRQEEENQREEGKKVIIDLLHVNPRSGGGLNLGKAWDGKNEKNKKWLDDSKFLEFEKALSDVLHAERALIQERNCIENLDQRISEAKMQLQEAHKKTEALRKTNDQYREKLGVAQSILHEVNYSGRWESPVRGQICKMADTAVKPWIDSLANEVAKLRERFNRHRTGKEVNDELAIVAARLGAEGNSKHFEKSHLLPQYVEWANQFCEAEDSKAKEKCNKAFKELGLPELPAPLSPTTEDLPSLSQDNLTQHNLQEKRRFLGIQGINSWIAKDFDGGTILAHIEGVAQVWRQQIEVRKDGWVNQLLTDHFLNYCEKRRKHFVAHIQRLLDEFEASAKPKEQAANDTEEMIKKMNEGLSHLDIPLENAVASMKR